MNPLLFGHNPEERLVSVLQKDDRTMRLFFREQRNLRSTEEPFYPFFFLTDRAYIEGFKRNHWVKRLEGTLSYQYLCVFEQWPDMWEAIRFVLDTYNRTASPKAETYANLDCLYLVTDPVSQFLMQSGRTLFKGMEFGDLHRLQLDIETYTPPTHRFSVATRKTDRIILIALSDNTGWTHLIDGRKLNESQMLQELVRIVGEKDPDVIEGHNILGFDIPYLITRAAMHDVTLALGRDGSAPRTFESRTSFAEFPFDYTVADIAGRHVIDTLLLLQSYDTTKRNLESYSLKYAAQHFGFASPERTYIQADRISWHWDHDVRPLLAYALDDARETEQLSAHLSPTSFYLTQMVPSSYGAVSRSGAATKIEQLMVREYLREKHTLPRQQEGTQTSGGLTDIFLTGVVGPVVHADVESLYPSIMITQGIRPASDVLKAFPELLKALTTMRIEAKRKAQRSTDPVEKSRLDATQSSMKILINSFYGYLGYSRGLFNDFAAADQVTSSGQKILRHMIDHLQEKGGKVIEADTDGIFFVPPNGVDTEEEELRFVKRLSDSLPEGITVAHAGRFKRMLSYKKKNYALLEYDSRIRIKGSALISRSMEQFGRTYLHQCIDQMLNGNVEGLHKLYVQYRQTILEHGMDVRDFSRVEALKDSLDVYRDEVASGKRNRSAAYEVAINSGKPVRPGDRISYYITGSDPSARGFENCKAAEDWDPNFPDENVPYYLRRLDEFSEKFAEFFNPADFRAIFSAEGLFPFDPTSITPLISDVREAKPEPGEDAPHVHPRIWLDDEK